MASGFYDSAGRDLDDVFELAPSYTYSVYNEQKGAMLGSARVTDIAHNQLVTNNNTTDLLKRYLHKNFGSTNTSKGGDFWVEYDIEFVDGNGNTEPSSRDTVNTRLNLLAATKGSSGGAPSWSSFVTINPAEYLMSSQSVTKDWASSGAATTGAFPITSYQIESFNLSRNSGSTSIFVSWASGYPKVEGGGCRVRLNLFADGGSATAVWYADVVMTASNVKGKSNQRTYRFVIRLRYRSTGGGGGGGGIY